MTFTFSKKDLIYSTLITLLLFYLVFNQPSSYQVKSEQIVNSSQQIEDQVNIPEEFPEELLGTQPDLSVIPHMFCSGQLTYYNLPTSTEFNPNYSYPTHMMGSGSHFQDINGDGLVDYIYNNVNLMSQSTLYEAISRSCVYLNNGNSWTRASICSARTKVDSETGNVVEAEYKGDCAANTSGNMQSE